MKEAYKEATKEYGHPSVVPWKNPFDFECTVENEWNGKPQGFSYRVSRCRTEIPMWSNGHKLAVRYSNNSFQLQNFDLPKTIIAYIIDALKVDNAEILHKLHLTCKYFFSTLPYPVLHCCVLLNKGIIR